MIIPDVYIIVVQKDDDEQPLYYKDSCNFTTCIAGACIFTSRDDAQYTLDDFKVKTESLRINGQSIFRAEIKKLCCWQ